jgi:hypothetical protein
MMPFHLIETALLLGLYILLAGGYGLAYTLAKLRSNPGLRAVAYALYGLHCAVAIGVVVWSPLGPGWKALLIASSLAMFAIPPITWRYLERTHGTGRASA